MRRKIIVGIVLLVAVYILSVGLAWSVGWSVGYSAGNKQG